MNKEIRDVFSIPFGEDNKSFKVPMQVYASVEEGDTAAGRVGAVLAEANNNLLYRGTYADARELICEIVTELTGETVAQKDSGQKNEDGTPIMVDAESDKVFVRRVLANNPSLFDKVQAVLTERADGYSKAVDGKITFFPALAADITQRERKPRKPVKLAAKYADTAKAFLTKAINPATGKPRDIHKFLDAVKKSLKVEWTPTGDAAKDIESLGWVCKHYADWKAEQANLAF